MRNVSYYKSVKHGKIVGLAMLEMLDETKLEGATLLIAGYSSSEEWYIKKIRYNDLKKETSLVIQTPYMAFVEKYKAIKKGGIAIEQSAFEIAFSSFIKEKLNEISNFSKQL